ncbi:Oxidoreductase family, C-terminal alpha/beta domain [Actinacidiphila alni]|uniref:Oxidoreductase family, C-terminal alpha/beta domain n=1 Tax=Actinacidiphila alni TaxID=380248 RepID=A0A1I2EFV8_9ACTN|nr:Oxidoreductase family, C-terminal alpha/beta domain [Actinacidiphila alni]
MTTTPPPALRVGMVGHAFMGAAHSHAWRTAGRFFDLPVRLELGAVCGQDEDRVARAARRYGWESYETDWRVLVTRPHIDVVDICTPGDSHAAIAEAAPAAGKHVLCEKPLANSVAEAEAMVDAARKDRAGSGALGDLGTHSVDAAQYLTGQRISSVGALLEPDPGRLRRGGRALRARGAPQRDRVRLLVDGARAGGDRAPPGLRPQFRPQPFRVAGPGPGRFPLRLPRPYLPRRLQGVRQALQRAQRQAGFASAVGRTCGAAGTSCRPGTAMCRGSRSSGCSTASATPGWTG